MNPIECLENRLCLDGGALDPTFGSGGMKLDSLGSLQTQYNDLIAQSNGKLIVAGSTLVGDTHDAVLVRYSSVGKIDKTFGSNGIARYTPGDMLGERVARNTDGSFLLAGRLSNTSTRIVKFSSSGKLDTSFGSGGQVTLSISTTSPLAGLFVRPDGKIIVVRGNTVFQLKSNGSTDSIWGTSGKMTLTALDLSNKKTTAYDAQLLPNGKLIIVGQGYKSSFCGVVMRIDSAGKLDKTFASGKGIASFYQKELVLRTVAIQSDGKIVTAGNDYDSTSYILRLKSDGTEDTGFNNNKKFNDSPKLLTFGMYNESPSDMVIQGDGRIVVVGSGTAIPAAGYTDTAMIARLNSSGSVDNSFSHDGARGLIFDTEEMSYSHAVAIASDGDLVVAIERTIWGEYTDNMGGLARFAANKTLGELTINGTSGNDKMILRSKDGTDSELLEVVLNGNVVKTFDSSDYSRLYVELGAGTDRFDFSVTSRGPIHPVGYRALPVFIHAGSGNDTVNGGPYADSIYGDAGNDKLSGGQGDDFIEGNAGNDSLTGGAGFDRLFGGSGDDKFYAIDGVKDLLDGGAGTDTFSKDAVDVVMSA